MSANDNDFSTEPLTPSSTEPLAPSSTEPLAPSSTEPLAPSSTEPLAPSNTDPLVPYIPGRSDPCSYLRRCPIPDLMAPTVASIVSLAFLVAIVWFRFPGWDLLIPWTILGVMYLLAVLYFYVGALHIQQHLWYHFRRNSDSWIKFEFVLRCAILTFVIVSLGLIARYSSSEDKLCAWIALLLLVATHIMYLVWDIVVYRACKGIEEVENAVWQRFLPGDGIGLIAAGLVLLMALLIPDNPTNGNHPNPLTGPPTWATFIGGLGALAYLGLVFGFNLENEKPSFDGGIWHFFKEALNKIKELKFR